MLGYGATWGGGGLRCTSATTGLTCRNQDGHGFFVSRENSATVLMTLSHRPSDDRGTNFVVGLTNATTKNGTGSRTLRLRLPAIERRWSDRLPKPGQQDRTVIVVGGLRPGHNILIFKREVVCG